MRPGILLLAALVFAIASDAVAQEADRSHWLRMRYQLHDETRGTEIDAETTIFHDGLVVTTTLQRGAFLVTDRGQATPSEIATLRRSLARNHIVEQDGNCEDPYLGGQNSSVRLLVTFFERSGGYHRFAVGRDLYETSCSQGTLQLIDDIMVLADRARGRGRWQVEEVAPEPPSPFSPCEVP